MGDETYSLGTDEINAPKIVLLILLACMIFILSWFAFNASSVSSIVLPFWALLTSVGLFWVMSKVIGIYKKGKQDIDFPNPVIYERKSLFGEFPKWMKVLLFSGAIIIGIIVFMTISGAPTMQLLSTPTFQAVEVTGNTASLLTIVCAVTEDFTFVMIMPALICGILVIIFSYVFGFSGKTAFFIAIAITLLANPLVFTFYHTARYGDNSAALESVFLFSLVMTSWVIFTRTPWLPLFVHAPNNLAIQFFSHHATDVTFIGITLIAVVVAMTAIYLWRSRK